MIPPAPRRRVVTGYFDPMTAAHAVRLSELRRDVEQLVVIVTEPPDPLLPARARAELVAGLAAVDYVVVSSANGLTASETIHEEERDLARRRALSEHVITRQNTTA